MSNEAETGPAYLVFTDDQARMTTYITAHVECSESLIRGRHIDPSTEELPYKLSFSTPDALFDFYEGDCLMSVRLADALASLGADNVQRFETELTDERSGQTRHDYVVVNIVGLATPTKNDGQPLFRHARRASEILMRHDIAKALEAAGFVGLHFAPLD